MSGIIREKGKGIKEKKREREKKINRFMDKGRKCWKQKNNKIYTQKEKKEREKISECNFKERKRKN